MSHQSLTCPITFDWLMDPIMSPCCGNAISRQPFTEWHQNNPSCPICRTSLNNFNPSTAPSVKNIIDMVNEAQQNNVILPSPPENQQKQEWTGTISRITNHGLSTIGKLELTNKNKQTNFKTLFIPTIDRSGSMAGSAFNQVKYSLTRIKDITYQNPQLITNLVSYCDTATTIEFNTTNPQSYYDDVIQRLNASGGTSFDSAFNEILMICAKYKNDNLISSIVILFLTDGEDSNVQKKDRARLVNSLKTNIQRIWGKPFIVHTIGFTGCHDDAFLNELRMIGNEEGAYRYADPKEDNDCISNKINSILNVISVASAIPIKISPTDPNLPMLYNESGKYWLNLTNTNMSNPLTFNLSINNQEPIIISADFKEEDNDPVICEQWASLTIDQIAIELITLSNQQENTQTKQLHCEILQQRIRAINSRLDFTSHNAERLTKLSETLTIILSGGHVDQRKLNDAKFEGQFKTKPSTTISLPSQNQSYQSSSYQSSSYKSYRYYSWTTEEQPKIKRCTANKNADEIFIVIGLYSANNACNYIENNYNELYQKDKNGATPLIVASSIGKSYVVSTILNYMDKSEINRQNNYGYNAIDMAILFGYWKTFDTLYENGAYPTIDGELLLRTCLSKKYYNLAERLIKHNIASTSDEMENGAPTGDIARWLNAKSQKDIPIEMAIQKGMCDEVTKKLNDVTTISLSTITDIFTNATSDHIRIINLLIANKKIDPNEIFNIMDNSEKEITWPLFMACEKGALNMVKTLIKHSNINQQNLRGTTCLWIACCNKHIDIVLQLLGAGANPNLSNLKGDSPLIPACQKGSDSIVELLLESGADINAYNKNRDNAILISCRTGQAKILEILLKRLSVDQQMILLNTYAEIDGFVPLLASTELDKTECIKVCVKYGADLETKTQNNNKIIAGSTALHLASFYGRVKAIQTLYELGANIMSQNIDGFTPLHISIKQGHKDATRYLLSLDDGKKCLHIRDNDGRLPIYYANKEGNETLLEEFFTNKLEKILSNVMFSDEKVEKACADILIKYGQSLGYYEYDEITSITTNDGSNLLSNALLTGNNHLVKSLMDMNCDLNITDNYGLSPLFWKTFLGHDVSNIKIPENTCAILDKVFALSKKNIQNKMLLNINPQHPMLDNHITNNTNLLTKMKDGYESKVHNNVLTTLKNSKDDEHTIMGFIDKLKNNKVFLATKNQLEYIIWSAKIHLVKMIASTDTHLDMAHLLSLYLYTSNQLIFENVNKSIVKYKDNDLWNPFVCCLYQAIDLLSPFVGEVYRGIDMPFDMETFALNKVLSWNTFATCSKEYSCPSELINLKRGIIFIVHSKTGRDISKFSKNPADGEVIFNPGTLMKVMNYYVASIICLGQENIRKTTYMMKENDMVKVIKGESCIIIELDEV